MSIEVKNSFFGRGVSCCWSVNWDIGSDRLELGYWEGGRVRCFIREFGFYFWFEGSF